MADSDGDTDQEQPGDSDDADDSDGVVSSQFTSGDPVLDTEDPDPTPGFVIHTPDSAIEEWTITLEDEEKTVAETNPEYDPEEPVVLVGYEKLLDEYWPEWTDASVHELFDGMCENGVKFYSFPESRLSADPSRPSLRNSQDQTDEDEGSNPDEDDLDAQQIEDEDESEEIEAEWEPPEWLEDLRELVADSAATEFDPDHEALQVEKLGEVYYVREDGEVEGDGLMRSKLESRVEDTRGDRGTADSKE